MRFLADGPSIPDELLIARDEGRVIFFCGAGVSYARAELPGFFELAEEVTDLLNATDDDPARKILVEAKEIAYRTGISGLISADRIFGLLERKFDIQLIESMVANALKPKPSVDLSAHRIMLDLARGPDGNTRIVTTNFDLLFESCDPSLLQSRPPRLPDPHRNDEFNGVIHLHGHVSKDYTRADGDGYVLSTSGFGRAYLSEAWATSFIRAILDKYIVVFVGYTADDPPVQYLLEALNINSISLDKVYAFQEGSDDEADAKWRHKGVRAIAYDEKGRHKALWDTLAAWANRAKDPESWYAAIIEIARKGPEALMPHQRGQVAHVVSSPEGANKFSSSSDPPPAEWLCVFDHSVRYSKPGRAGSMYEQGPSFDPFYDAYGIDSDPPPPKVDPEDYFTRREIPEDVWNCFAVNRIDIPNIKEDSYPALTGHSAVNVPALPGRQWNLGLWISRVSNQPAAVWWASAQAGIHPRIQSRIRYELEQNKGCSSEIRKAWNYIFESWETNRNDINRDFYQLKAFIDLDGWTISAVKEFARMHRPFLTCEKPIFNRAKPPAYKEDIYLNEMIHLDVKYPWPGTRIQIPEEFLITAVREFRKNLEHAVFLENEIGGFGLRLCPIEPDPNMEGDSSERTDCVSRLCLFFVSLLKKLISQDPDAVKCEYLAWWTGEDPLFTQLKIWLSGYQQIFSGSEAGRILCTLSDHAFWNERHQRDLLLVIKKRWNDFSGTMRKRLEKRLLKGRPPYKDEEKYEFIKRRAMRTLNRIHWLKNQGCQFSFDFKEENSKLLRLSPQWLSSYAEKAAASMEGRVVERNQSETDYSALLDEPLETLFDKAKELHEAASETFVRNEPLKGLIAERPELVLAALKNYARRNSYPAWAWRQFLYAEERDKDNPEMTIAITNLIINIPQNALNELIAPISEWLANLSKSLFQNHSEQFGQIWTKLVVFLNSNPGTGKSSLVRSRKSVDWATEALNSPVGNLSKAILNDPALRSTTPNKGFPSSLAHRLEDLLELPEDLRLYALTMFSYHLNFFYANDSDWTEKNLIAALDQKDDSEAFWDGFFWHAEIPTTDLYRRLKPHLLILASSLYEAQHSGIRVQVLAGILLAGWTSIDEKMGERFVTSKEMRKALSDANEEFRLQVLWHLQRRISKNAEKDEKNIHADSLHVFLTEVWPLGKKVKSPKISASILEIVFTSEETFSKNVDQILLLKLITEIERDFFGFYILERENIEIVDHFPEKMLSIIYAVLPKNALVWPYHIENIIERIGMADSVLLKDYRLIELKRRLNVR